MLYSSGTDRPVGLLSPRPFRTSRPGERGRALAASWGPSLSDPTEAVAERPERVGTRPERKEATRRRILDAAFEVFAERGYHEAVVDEIVRVSQTSKGAFYFHFPSKQDIFLRLVDELVERLSQKAEAAIARADGDEAKVDAALGAVFDAFSGHRQLAKILLVDVVGLGRAFDQKLLGARGRLALVIQRYLDDGGRRGAHPSARHRARRGRLARRDQRGGRPLAPHRRPESLDAARPALRRLLLNGVGLRSASAHAERRATASHSRSGPAA